MSVLRPFQRISCAALLIAAVGLPATAARADDEAPATTESPGLDLSGEAPAPDAKPKKKRRKKVAPVEEPAPAEAAPADAAAAPTDATPSDATPSDAPPATDAAPTPDAAPADAAKPAPAPTPQPDAAKPAPAAAVEKPGDKPAEKPADKPSSDSPKKLALHGPSPTVTVVFEGTDPGTRDQANRVETELSAALGRDGRLLPAASAATTAAPAANTEIQQHIKAAQDAYAGLDLDTATKEYAEAIKSAFTTPETADVELVAKTFLAMGASYQLNGDVAHADGAYRFALALRPALQPDANLYGPDIRKSVEAQRTALDAAAQASPATLDIDVEGPPSADVTVDGNPAGSSPIRGFKVWPGRHIVVAHAAGYQPKASVGLAKAGEGGDVKVAMEETPEHRLIAGARERALSDRQLPQPGPGTTELAQKTGATAVIVGSLASAAAGTHIELTLFDVRTGRRIAGVTREAVVESARFPEVMDALALELGNDWVEPPEDALVADSGTSKPIYKRWYFWAGVGTAVVAGAAVAYVATQPSSGHSPFGAGTALGLPLTAR